MGDRALGDCPFDSDETAMPQNDPVVDLPIESWTITIADIAVKNVAVDLQRVIMAMRCQRIPIGMYIAMELNELRYKTATKSIPYAGDIRWDDKIILPLNTCTHICFKIYASFELERMIGIGELLYTFRTTVQEVLDRKEGPLPFPLPFQPGVGDLSFSLTFDMSHCREDVFPFPPSRSCDPLDSIDDTYFFAQATDRGHDALFRYRRYQQEQELINAINHFETASTFCHFFHPCYPTACFNLAATKFIRHHVDRNYADLDNVIMSYLASLQSRPLGDRDRENTLLHLTVALLSRSKYLVADAKLAVHQMDIILELPPDDNFLRQAAVFAVQTYTPPGRACDAVQVSTHSILWSPGQIGQILGSFRTEGVWEGGIERCREELLDCSLEQPFYLRRKWKLAIALKSRSSNDDTRHLDEAILHLQDCVVLFPTNACLLHELAMSFISRFDCLGADGDLNDAIRCFEKGLELQPGHGVYALNLIVALDKRFQRHRNQRDLDDAIKHGFQVLFSPPLDWYDLPAAVNHALRLKARWGYGGNRIDLESCIEVLESALDHLPDNHSCRPRALNLLADVLLKRFSYSGDERNLSDAILHSREAVTLCPDGHWNRPEALYSLAGTLRARFHQRGDLNHLSEAIATYQAAVSLKPDSVFFLGDVATAKVLRFEYQGNKQDLDDGILQLRKCLLQPVDHVNLAILTAALASALYSRFSSYDNDLRTLDEAIQCFQQGLALPCLGHPSRAVMLGNYGMALHARYIRQPDNQISEQAVGLFRESLALHAVDDASRALALANLGSALVHLGSEEAVDEAILLQKEALKLSIDNTPLFPRALWLLATAYFKRYRKSQDGRDFEDADQYARRALESYYVDDPRRSDCLLLIAEIQCSILDRELHQPASDNYDPFPTQYFKSVTRSRHTGTLSSLNASLQWASYAEKNGHDSALQAYERSIQILDDNLSSNAFISSRLEFMKEIPPSLAADAASSALRHGNIIRAIELLEQGRTLVWTQMARSRTPIDQLLQGDENSKILATKFQNLSTLLNNAQKMERFEASTEAAEQAAKRYEQTLSDWNKVVEEIRELDGFGSFLCHPLFSDLREAACEGPVIILVASRYSCDAVVVLHRQSPLHIPLATDLRGLVELAEDVQRTVRSSRDNTRTEVKLREGLQKLWDIVVSPVVTELVKVTKRRSRIWWCPTSALTLLPLHAAGEYFREGGKYLSQFYVSSYTPSLSALIKARTNLHKTTTKTKHLAAIGQSQPHGHTLPLLSVERELDILQSLVPKGTIKFSKVPSGVSTKSAAIRALRDNTWVHFSCHGIQKLEEPFNSCFMMLDEPLTLLDIMKTDLTSHEFAFLSACQTAVGHIRALDEVIHLAAGLQFGGVKSVIGSMWEVEDATVGHLVKEFYSEMFAGGKADCTKAARALHKALRSEASKRMSLAQRIVFIHIGI